MPYISREKREFFGQRKLRVSPRSARLHAGFTWYEGVAQRFRGAAGWSRSTLADRPTTVWDLSDVPLFYDFPVKMGRRTAGFVRAAANKSLAGGVVATQVNAPGWDLRAARGALGRLVERKYSAYRMGRVRLYCYNYPKLALGAELTSSRGRKVQLLVDVGDLQRVPDRRGDPREELGQFAYSLLDHLPEDGLGGAQEIWEREEAKLVEAVEREPRLEPERVERLSPARRKAFLAEASLQLELFQTYVQKSLDFCCHTGECHDHECFCLHPQENSVHCARASGQMMLCYWRYCASQSQIAQAYGVTNSQLTPVSAVVPGLETLTNNCFDATLDWTVGWSDCKDEIDARRPFMSCVPGHARACAGYKQWNLWIQGTPRPRSLYISDPWPPNTGAISWENYNTTNHLCMFTLERRTTSH